jgi:hypothetical protein
MKNSFPLDFPHIRWFLAISLTGAIIVSLVCLLAPASVQVGLVGVLVVLVLSLAAVGQLRPGLAEQFELVSSPMALARDQQLFELYQAITGSLKETSLESDPIYRQLALERISHVSKEMAEIADGRILFTGTETWRMAYGRLLSGPGAHHYRSVAHVKTPTYWQDEPGRQSMHLNYRLVGQGKLNVERIAIIPDHLWPAGERVPVEPLHRWLQDQHDHGVCLKLVHESALATESDLVDDFGIYGNRAVGFHQLDDHGRTVSFTLCFDFPELLAAEQRWERLSVYATSYSEILGRNA